MSTSGGTTLNAALYLVGVMVAASAALALARAESPVQLWRGTPRPAALAEAGVWLAVAVPSLLQIPFPELFRALRRDPDLIRHHGQVWRVLTSVLVQDGGIAGTVFNLVLLAVVLAFAAPVWGAWTPVVFVACQLLFNVTATFVSSDLGGGNSGAGYGLAASVAGLGLVVHRTRGPVSRAAGVLLVGLALVWLDDAHGIAFLGGLLLGALIGGAGPARQNSLIGERVWQDGRRDAHG